jgi:hypothetical protein
MCPNRAPEGDMLNVLKSSYAINRIEDDENEIQRPNFRSFYKGISLISQGRARSPIWRDFGSSDQINKSIIKPKWIRLRVKFTRSLQEMRGTQKDGMAFM